MAVVSYLLRNPSMKLGGTLLSTSNPAINEIIIRINGEVVIKHTKGNQSRKLKSRYGARNRFQEPSLELSSQATQAGRPVRHPYAYLPTRWDLSYRLSSKLGWWCVWGGVYFLRLARVLLFNDDMSVYSPYSPMAFLSWFLPRRRPALK